MIHPGSRLGRALAASALGLFLFAGAAWGGEPTDQLRTVINQVLQVLRDSSLKGDGKQEVRRNLLRDLAQKQFDFTDMARRALATHWRKRTPEERKEFTALFSRALERRYVGKLDLYTDEVIRYDKEIVDGNFARVNTSVITKKKQEITLHYRMHKIGENWKVYDVVIEGVSLVNNYRSQFGDIIRRSSYADLVKKLRAKQDGG